MTDKEIAIAHMVLCDAEKADGVERFRAHWASHFDGMTVAEHSGDCTKQPWACGRCHAEEAMKMVPVYRALFGLRSDA